MRELLVIVVLLIAAVGGIYYAQRFGANLASDEQDAKVIEYQKVIDENVRKSLEDRKKLESANDTLHP